MIRLRRPAAVLRPTMRWIRTSSRKHPYRDTIRDDLRAVPTLSLVLNPNDLWDFENGLYCNPERRGDQWERAGVDGVDRSGRTECVSGRCRFDGARRLGASFHLHVQTLVSSGVSRQVRRIDARYAAVRTDGQTEYQQLVLRGGFNDSWQGGDRNNTFMQDQWVRQAHAIWADSHRETNTSTCT